MNNEKFAALETLYREFDNSAEAFQREAVCASGCAFCCTDAGRIDITTLEGKIIRERIYAMPSAARKKLFKALSGEMRQREKGNIVPCPFLRKNRTCQIYEHRPFSCRQLYSLKKCGGGQSPVVHKRSADLTQETIIKMQQMDDTGYTGHISYILFMLEQPEFRKIYDSGKYEPARIMNFGKSHGIIINQLVSPKNS